MKLLCITDLHSNRDALVRILTAQPDADAVLLGGDITNFGTPADAEDVVLRLAKAYERVLAVAGNCDSEAIDQRLAELDVTLFRRGVVWRGVGFYGVSAMPPWLSTMYHLTEQQIGEALEAGRSHVVSESPECEVVVSHPPPKDTTVDKTHRGEHVGSVAVRRFVDRVQPSLVVCGHIHEGRGVDRLGRTLIVNCGPAFRGCYAVASVGESVDVELLEA